jgi:hypothetical protein
MGTKRAATGGQVRSSRKRQKTQPNPEPDQKIKGQPEHDHANNQRQDQVFRFMELPGGKVYCSYKTYVC